MIRTGTLHCRARVFSGGVHKAATKTMQISPSLPGVSAGYAKGDLSL